MSRPMRGRLLCVRYLQRFTVRVVDVYEWREAAVDGDSSPDEGPQSVGVGDPDPKHLAQISTKDGVSNEKKRKTQKKTNIPFKSRGVSAMLSLTDLVCEHSMM